MIVGLIDVDSHNFPNLALMKLSSYWKKQGSKVEFARPQTHYDRIYVSKVFTQSIEPDFTQYNASEWFFGGSGYDLTTVLPDEIEHSFPDYTLYPQFKYALGFLTRGCPRMNHTFCITPKKDGCRSRKVADLSEFWNGQSHILLLDQNILACPDANDLLQQLVDSGASVEFNGGLDIRFLNEQNIELFRQMKVIDYHFAWDDPKENLFPKFQQLKDSGIVEPKRCGVYVLTNYWSTIQEDLDRIYHLRSLGFSPFVMIFDKQKYVDEHGHWLPDVCERFSQEQLIHFKTCQHMQRWCNHRAIQQTVADFNDYERYQNWIRKGSKVPKQERT